MFYDDGGARCGAACFPRLAAPSQPSPTNDKHTSTCATPSTKPPLYADAPPFKGTCRSGSCKKPRRKPETSRAHSGARPRAPRNAEAQESLPLHPSIPLSRVRLCQAGPKKKQPLHPFTFVVSSASFLFDLSSFVGPPFHICFLAWFLSILPDRFRTLLVRKVRGPPSTWHRTGRRSTDATGQTPPPPTHQGCQDRKLQPGKHYHNENYIANRNIVRTKHDATQDVTSKTPVVSVSRTSVNKDTRKMRYDPSSFGASPPISVGRVETQAQNAASSLLHTRPGSLR